MLTAVLVGNKFVRRDGDWIYVGQMTVANISPSPPGGGEVTYGNFQYIPPAQSLKVGEESHIVQVSSLVKDRTGLPGLRAVDREGEGY